MSKFHEFYRLALAISILSAIGQGVSGCLGTGQAGPSHLGPRSISLRSTKPGFCQSRPIRVTIAPAVKVESVSEMSVSLAELALQLTTQFSL